MFKKFISAQNQLGLLLLFKHVTVLLPVFIVNMTQAAITCFCKQQTLKSM